MKSMRFKLWAGMMALITIILILLWLFQVVFLESFYTGMRTSKIKDEAYSILELLPGEKEEFEKKLEAFVFNNNLSIELLDKEGNAVYLAGTTGGGQMPMMRNNIRLESFTTAINGDEAAFPFNHPRFGNRFQMLGLPVRTSEGISGVLLINMPLAPVEDTASIIKLQLIYITLLLLAASLLISFRLAESFTGPILAIKNASERMASGDYSVRIAIRKSDEIGQLAETVNYLGEQLSKVEQLRKDLIANVSHELRTPLSLIRGYAETIRDITGKIPEKREKQLEIIIEETERLGRIVDDILHLSQLQAGYIALKIRPFNVRKKLAALVDRYHVLGKEAGVSIKTESPEDIWALADEDRIEQVIINLLNNSISHTPRGGSILVKAKENSETIRFEISDTGSGIPEEEIPYIWGRFYKADKTGKRNVSGTGLGLAIVKGVLEAHQAAFGVESEEGQGSEFWFELKRYI